MCLAEHQEYKNSQEIVSVLAQCPHWAIRVITRNDVILALSELIASFTGAG